MNLKCLALFCAYAEHDDWNLFQAFKSHLPHLRDEKDILYLADQFSPRLREKVQALVENLEQLKQDEAWMVDQGVYHTTYGEAHYPPEFLELKNPPLNLFVMGSPLGKAQRRISVVGAREIQQETIAWMKIHFFEWLRGQEITVVSGGARGVDQLAHRCAYRAGRPTLVFLPSGLNQIYPKNLISEKKVILQNGGSFYSQFPPSAAMKNHFFYMRNQLIASLSPLLFVVQAAEKGGSMMTAKWATELHREVLTLPQDPLRSEFSGNLQLLMEGVTMLRDRADLEMAASRKCTIAKLS